MSAIGTTLSLYAYIPLLREHVGDIILPRVLSNHHTAINQLKLNTIKASMSNYRVWFRTAIGIFPRCIRTKFIIGLFRSHSCKPTLSLLALNYTSRQDSQYFLTAYHPSGHSNRPELTDNNKNPPLSRNRVCIPRPGASRRRKRRLFCAELLAIVPNPRLPTFSPFSLPVSRRRCVPAVWRRVWATSSGCRVRTRAAGRRGVSRGWTRESVRTTRPCTPP